MATSIGFKAISDHSARVLILGSLPGVESLKQQEYYARKQNSFWKIMGTLLGAAPDLPYEKRLSLLKEKHIALWDVCASATRQGSLDSNIRSVKVNNFGVFFKKHISIELICFNGQYAAKLFQRFVKPSWPLIPHITLPSTSPAHASMRFQDKLSYWRDALAPFAKP